MNTHKAVRTLVRALCLLLHTVMLSFLLKITALAGFPSYKIDWIGTLGGSWSDASALSNDGKVVGSSDTGNSTRAFVWDSVNGISDIGVTPLSYFSSAYAINSADQVTGYSFSGGYMRNLMSGTTYVISKNGFSVHGIAINESGKVAGNRSTGIIGGGRAVIWDRVGGSVDFPFHQYVNYYSAAADINNAGHVVGTANMLNYIGFDISSNQAFRWDGGNQRNNITQITPGSYSSSASAINDAGLIVGSVYQTSASPSVAFLYTPNASLIRISPLNQGTSSWGIDVNDSNVVLCGQKNQDNSQSYFLWKSTLGGCDLTSLIPSGIGADINLKGINSRWQIVGTATVNGQTRAFLLTPKLEIPKPSVEIVNPTKVRLTFEAQSYLQYQCKCSPDLFAWEDLNSPIIHQEGTIQVDIDKDNASQMFFKIEVRK